MGLKDLELKPAYETLNGSDPVRDFYIPALSESISYDRSVGFFNSASLALAARGVAGLLSNGGRMRLIVSPHLAAEDIKEIRQSSESDGIVESRLCDLLGDIDGLADEIERDHVRALGWMLSQGYLEMKVAYITDDNGAVIDGQLFHQKVGLMKDAEGDAISFSGSINETASGWLFNSEEFKVFKSWDEGQSDFYEADAHKFAMLWTGSHPHVRTFKPTGCLCDKLVAAGSTFELENSALRRYQDACKTKTISLFPYQRDAYRKWRSCGGKMLFEMATGTGKTRTALACVEYLLMREKRLVCVVATPQNTLSRQWKSSADELGIKFDAEIFADSSEGTSSKWLAKIREAISAIAIGRKRSLIVYTTHKSAANPRLIAAIREASISCATCLVGDGVHGMGSHLYRAALDDSYAYRIGLSATPTRWFDEQGTKIISDFFGRESFEFTIKEAQETNNPITGAPFLCPYRYHLIQVEMTDEEAVEYCELTKRIGQLLMFDAVEGEELIERLALRRANIKKDAAGKSACFDRLLGEVEQRDLLVFTSPNRINEVEQILLKHRVMAKRITERQGTRPEKRFAGISEREYLINAFRRGDLQALVAIKCLDEGIDIPQARTAILLSSSTNPREYIQRVGRVIRRSPGKDCADVYDFVVVPDMERMRVFGDMDAEKRLFEKELVRIEEMRANAVNRVDLLFEIENLKGKFNGD